MTRFQLQKRAHNGYIWFKPDATDIRSSIVESDSVSELRTVIKDEADKTSFPYWAHFRIITYRGEPVERWKIKPGRAVRTRSNS